jgi:hypothetical protein
MKVSDLHDAFSRNLVRVSHHASRFSSLSATHGTLYIGYSSDPLCLRQTLLQAHKRFAMLIVSPNLDAGFSVSFSVSLTSYSQLTPPAIDCLSELFDHIARV